MGYNSSVYELYKLSNDNVIRTITVTCKYKTFALCKYLFVFKQNMKFSGQLL